MSMSIRSASHEDVGSIAPWTTSTFDWGDYVPERMPQWLDQSDSEVLVCVDDADYPIAVAHVVMLSPTEGWMEAARVHPDHRRRGLGSALNDAGVRWASERGARVMRLATEADNEVARAQVETLEYRLVSNWVYASLEVDPTHRASDQFRLRPAPGSDAEAAWLFWAASDLARVGRELIALGWQWRTARPEDMGRTSEAEIFQSAGGWVGVVQPETDWLMTHWFATTPEDLLMLLDGLLDMAAERGVTEVSVKLPNLGWTSEALTRVGGQPKEILIYAKPV